MIFVFGVTAALASVFTEAISRFIGLRGAYLLTGLRELVDNGAEGTALTKIETAYTDMRDWMRGNPPPSQPPSSSQPQPSQPQPQPSSSQPSPPSSQPSQPPSQPPSQWSQPLQPSLPPPSQPPPPSSSQPQQPPSATEALLGGPILSNQGVAGQMSSRKLTLGPTRKTGRLPKMTPDGEAGGLWAQRRSLPAYISGESFAEAVIDLVVPNAAGTTTMDAIAEGVDRLPPGTPLKTSLQALIKNAEGDVSRFRTSVENWYNDHMDRVSGWYKRNAAKITLAAGAILIVLLNINALTIGRTLYTDSTVSTAVSSVAAKATNCPKGQDPKDCLTHLQAQLSAATTAGLPIGWGTVRDCMAPGAKCNWWDQRGLFSRHGHSAWQFVLVLIGFLIMIIAIVPGAQFWFGLLSRIGTLRSAGPKPAGAGN